MSTTTTTAATTPALNSYLPVLARLLMCSLFIWDGVLQLRNPAAAVGYFTSLNVPVPHIAVWVSIAVHLLGGAAILIGFMTRWAAAPVDFAVSRHRFRRASVGRRHGQHDELL